MRRTSFSLLALLAPACGLQLPATRRQVLRSASVLGASAALPLPALAASADYTTLSDGLRFPLASFGLQIYDDATAERLTRVALDAGFRNFFASVLAGNQRGFARAIGASAVPRSELFICGTVLSNRASGYDAAYKLTKRGCDENLAAFSVGGIDKLDMIM